MVCRCQEVEALEELMKTVDGSKYSVHASSILESHDVSEPAATQSAVASSQVKCFTLTTTATQGGHKVGSTVFVYQIHLAAYGLLDAVCTQITKSVFPEVVQNSSSFPCSEKSPSIPVFQVCGHPVTVQHWFIPNPELISKNISKWFFQPAVNKSGYPSASDSFTLIISQVYVDSDHIRNFQPHPGYVTTLPENT